MRVLAVRGTLPRVERRGWGLQGSGPGRGLSRGHGRIGKKKGNAAQPQHGQQAERGSAAEKDDYAHGP